MPRFAMTDEGIPSPVQHSVVKALTSLEELDPEEVDLQLQTPSRPTLQVAINMSKVPDPIIKCNDCGTFIKQSVFEEHKQSHVTPSRPKPRTKIKLFRSSKRGLDRENNPSDTCDGPTAAPVTPEPKRRKVERSKAKSDGPGVDVSRSRTVKAVSSKFGDVEAEEEKVSIRTSTKFIRFSTKTLQSSTKWCRNVTI